MLKKRIFALVFLLILVLSILSPVYAADNSTGALILLLPYDMPWLNEAVAKYKEEAGITVQLVPVYNNIEMKAIGGTLDDIKREYIKSDIIEKTIDHLKGYDADVDMYYCATTSGIPLYSKGGWHSPVDINQVLTDTVEMYNISAFARDSGSLIIPLTFDKNVLVTNTALYDGPIPATRSEYAEMCTGIEEQDGVYATSDAKPIMMQNLNAWLAKEFLYEAFGYIDMNAVETKMDNDDFIRLMNEYVNYYTSMGRVKNCGNLENKLELIRDGKVVSGTVTLGEALMLCAENPDLVISNVPYVEERAAGYYSVSSGICVTESAQKEASVAFLKWLLTYELSTELIESGYCVPNKSLMENYVDSLSISSENTDTAKEMLNSLTQPIIYDIETNEHFSTSYVNDIAADATYEFILYAGYLPGSSIKSNVVDKADAAAYRLISGIDENLKPWKATTVNMGWLIIPIAVIIGFSLLFIGYLLIKAAMTIGKRVKEFAEVRKERYGPRFDVVRGSRLIPILITLVCAGVFFLLGYLIVYLPELADYYSSVPVNVRRLLMWMFVCIGTAIVVYGTASALLSRVELCEEAIIVVNGLNLRVIYLDNIEKIYVSDTRYCTIAINYDKSEELHNSRYIQLPQKLRVYTARVGK